RKRLQTLTGSEHSRGAPVAGEPPAVSCEQYSVDRAGGGTQIFLILHRIDRAERGRSDECRRAVKLGRRLRTGSLLQPGERERANYPEAPRVRQVMIWCPSCQREQLVQQLARDGLRAKRLVGAPVPDRSLNIHAVQR